MKIKTSELSGVALDWAVAQIAGRKLDTIKEKLGTTLITGMTNVNSKFVQWSPSTDWSQGGPLIERFRVHVDMMIYDDIVRYWEANLPDQPTYEIGDTPLQAACRAIVAAELGDEVDVLEGLV